MKSEDAQKRRTQEAAMNLGAAPNIIVPIGSDDDRGDSVLRKDPNVELTKIQLQMGLAVPPYEGTILQVTPFDHPIQTMSIISDLTMLEWMKALGLPKNVYELLKGESYMDEKGGIHIMNTGFFGFMRARMGLLYPGLDGMMFHPREQILRGTRKDKDEKKAQAGWVKRLLGGENP